MRMIFFVETHWSFDFFIARKEKVGTGEREGRRRNAIRLTRYARLRIRAREVRLCKKMYE